MQSVPIGAPLEMIAMDFVGPLPCTERGNKYVLVVGDYFSKWAEAYPLPDQKAETVVSVVVRVCAGMVFLQSSTETKVVILSRML